MSTISFSTGFKLYDEPVGIVPAKFLAADACDDWDHVPVTDSEVLGFTAMELCGFMVEPDPVIERANLILAGNFEEADWATPSEPSTHDTATLKMPSLGRSCTPLTEDTHGEPPCLGVRQVTRVTQGPMEALAGEAHAHGGPLLCPQDGNAICHSLAGPGAFLDRGYA